jgi:hypothetical protein
MRWHREAATLRDDSTVRRQGMKAVAQADGISENAEHREVVSQRGGYAKRQRYEEAVDMRR